MFDVRMLGFGRLQESVWRSAEANDDYLEAVRRAPSPTGNQM
jgi:hypothetical protein